jgi:glycosyltransferase involved in cell wall biosynthesis
MKSILMVTTVPMTLTGFLLPFARHFRAQGWRVDAMALEATNCAKCVELFDRVWDVEWSRNPLDLSNFLKAPPIIRKVVDRGQYDIVHVHTPVAAFVTRYALKNWQGTKKPQLIYTAHGFHFHSGGNPLTNAIFIALEKLAGSWTDYLVTINREDEEAAKRYQLVPSDRIHYMSGIGVDSKYYHPDATSASAIERVRQELGLTSETPLFLSIAELNPGKRHRDILKALAKLGGSDVCMAFAGDGLLLDELKLLASQLGVADRVRFLGFRRDIITLIRASTATILASEREGLPRSIMESLCLETPVIGTNIRGIKDLLAEQCGLLVEVGDSEGLAGAMAWILEHPQETRAMGTRGRKRMASYDIKRIIELHEALYERASAKESLILTKNMIAN